MRDDDCTGTAGRRGPGASSVLMTLSAGEKDRILEAIASVLEENAAAIFAANARDLDAGRERGLPENLLDRMLLDQRRLGRHL